MGWVLGVEILNVNPFRAPEPLPILNPSNFVPQNGFPVVKGLRGLRKQRLAHLHDAVACVRDMEKPRHGSVLHRENPLLVVTSPTSRARGAADAPVLDGPSCSANDE